MASNYQESESYEKNLEIFEDELADSLEGLENNFLYEEIWDNKGNIIEDILDNLLDNGVMTENGIISVFAKHNIYISSGEYLKSK